MQDRYQMTREESVFLARKLLAQQVWRAARLEGCNVTFPDTQSILDGAVPAGLTTDDVAVVLNLREAWRYLLSALDEPFGLELVRGINARVAHGLSLAPGQWRDGAIGISGTDWRPAPPTTRTIEEVFALAGPATERAITFATRAMRAQLFWDGNKRTALLAANHLLLSSGAGMLSIPEQAIPAFNRELTAFYNTGDAAPLTAWLYSSALTGLDRPRERER
jgi:hypothetical protein